MTKGGLYKTIFHASAPTVVAFLLQSAFNIVDAFFVGKISSEALAAVSISFPIVFIIISIGSGLSVGVTSLAARYVGAKKYTMADNIAEHAILSAAVAGVILSVCGILVSPILFDFMGATGSLKVLAVDYINIILLFSTLNLFAMVGNGIMWGEGDMKTPMLALGGAAVLNIILDPFFIFVLGWGVSGAAVATVIARTCGMIYLFIHILSDKSKVNLNWRDFKYDFTHIRSIFGMGIPSALSNVIMSVSMFLLTAIVGTFGVDAIAAFGVGFRLDSIAILPAMGVSISMISIVGQNIGAKKSKRARDATIWGGIFASAFMCAIGAIFYMFSREIISVFNTSPDVVEYGSSFLRIIPVSYVVVGVAMSMSGAFLGAGKAMLSLTATFLRALVFSVPLAYLLSTYWGVEGVWWGVVIGSYLGALSCLIFYKYAKWDSIQANQ